ncbi:hypothetical protein [Bradyrhizobium guangzhouense]|uniref:Uncharacterized protein n=1 Tax=Bradyrhizobium guangzhouense TaxID=1325095 RepID=A0AAE5WWH0_9BRAD|nr:hypothetical protein [Bradyrhizobium guangzhouense]QAU44347.1 hypothetical protein XH91_02555 [Bradyrhizobium guangzhouense]RXH09348.1 hypothetical protein EAS54_34240 [Bradyrhizobium guangzhouense]RXH10083.1 hypothetical protein EAS56_24425 [Bradyrhizobium guangzhouense]
MASTPANFTSLPVSEHLLRHRDPVAITNSSSVRSHVANEFAQSHSGRAAAIAADGTGNVSPVGAKPSSTAWPFYRKDASALAWWRTLPREMLREADNLVLHATLGQISLMRPGNGHMMPLIGNPAAAIAEAFDLVPIAEATLEVDIVMSSLMVSALSGDIAAALVLSYGIRHTRLDHPFAVELSASWLAENDRRLSCGPIKGTKTERLPVPHMEDDTSAIEVDPA